MVNITPRRNNFFQGIKQRKWAFTTWRAESGCSQQGWVQTQLKSERRWNTWVRTVSLCHTYHPTSEKGNWGTWQFPHLPKTGRRADETSPTTAELHRLSAELGLESIFVTFIQMSWFLLGNEFPFIQQQHRKGFYGAVMVFLGDKLVSFVWDCV